MLPREVAKRDPAQYASMAPDNRRYKIFRDCIDFSVQAAVDPVVRGMHYRHGFSSDDIFGQDCSNHFEQPGGLARSLRLVYAVEVPSIKPVIVISSAAVTVADPDCLVFPPCAESV